VLRGVKRFFSHRPQRSSRDSLYATVSGLSPWLGTPPCMSAATDPISSSRSPCVLASELPLAGFNVTKTNNMTSNMTPLEVAMSPELN
jgi:hypothetical protein